MKKIISIGLCSIMLLSSCGTVDSIQTEPDLVSSESKNEETNNETTEGDQETDIVHFTGMGQFEDAFDFEEPGLKALYDSAGVDIEWEVVPNSSYGERLTIVLTSTELPDLMYLPSYKDYKDCYEEGLLIELGDLIANSPNIQLYEDPMSLKAVTTSDGNIYAIPRNSVPRTDGFVIRKDWLDNLDMSIPENGIVTLDEFTEIMRAFTEDDPDGNGEDDTFGYTARATNGQLYPFDRVLTALSSSNLFEVAPEESEYEYMNPRFSLNDDSYVKALEYTSMLWTSGYIDPNWPANDGNTYHDRFYAGIAGMANCFGGWLADWDKQVKANFPEAELGYIYGIANEEGEVSARSSLGANIFGYWTIAHTAIGKEDAIVRFLDHILSDEGWDVVNFGVEGIHYNLVDGEKVFTDIFTTYPRNQMSILRRSNSPDLWLSPSYSEEELTWMREVIDQCIENVKPSLDLSYVPEAASVSKFIDYQTTLDTTLSKIIVGEIPAESWYDAVEGWYQAGGTEYLIEMNEYIKSLQEE